MSYRSKLSLFIAVLTLATPIYANQASATSSKSDVVAETPADDAKITSTVKSLIKNSNTLSGLNIKVSTHKGVVSLEGNVESDSQAGSLVEMAESVIGVSDVDTSKLTVKDSQQPFADTITTAKVKGLLIREKLFGEKDVAAMETSVETKDGVVYLTGVVDNKAQVDNAVELIKKNIPEVKKVEYNMKKITPVNQ